MNDWGKSLPVSGICHCEVVVKLSTHYLFLLWSFLVFFVDCGHTDLDVGLYSL